MDEEKIVSKLAEHETKLGALQSQCDNCFRSLLPGIEARLRSVETRLAVGFGAVIAFQILIPLLLTHFWKR